MRHVALPLLVISTLMLSGCVDFFTPTAEDIENAERPQEPADQNGPADDPTGAADPDEGSTGTGDPAGGSGKDPDANGTNENAPDDSGAVPPNEQLQDSPDDIDRPGEYALLPKASANSQTKTNVPEWSTGAVWTYDSKVVQQQPCRTTTKVNGTGEAFEVPTYHVYTASQNGCGSQANLGAFDHAAADLMRINKDGCIDHQLVFPLEDGKRWQYHPCSSSSLITATVDFEPGYLWNLKAVSAWHVTLEYDNGVAKVEMWYGIDAQNVLREEIWVKQQTWLLLVEKDLDSYDH